MQIIPEIANLMLCQTTQKYTQSTIMVLFACFAVSEASRKLQNELRCKFLQGICLEYFVISRARLTLSMPGIQKLAQAGGLKGLSSVCV